MPEFSRLAQQEYDDVSKHISALEDSLRFLQGVSRWLAPGAQVSEAAYQEMVGKTDTALRAHVQRSQIALAVWEVQKKDIPHA